MNAPDTPELQARREVLGFALAQARSAVPALWLVMSMVAWLGWRAGLVWQPLVFLLAGLISGLWRLHGLHAGQGSAPLPPERLNRVEHQVQAGMLFSGLSWGFASLTMFPRLPESEGLVHLLIVLSNVSAAAFMSSTVRYTYPLLAVPAVLPMIGWLVYRGSTTGLVLAGLLPVYLLVMLQAAKRLRTMTLLAIERGHEMARTNVALRQAMLNADAAGRAKTRFMATMSHELRTPMNGLLTALELVGREPLAPPQQRLVGIARSCGEGLLAVLNDVLDYAKIDVDKVVLRPQPMQPAALVASVLDLFAAAAEAKGLVLRSELSADLTPWVQADVQRLRQVLLNLVGNAVKFTDRGEVVMRVVRVDDLPQRLRFEVQDTGIGIDAAAQATLFQPFRQVHDDSNRPHGGTGLGLAISQRLVLAMGGMIDVASQRGAGACFGFTLALPPAEPAVAASPAMPADVPLSDLPRLSGRVLLVEDNEVNRMLGTELLKVLSLQVQVAEDGRQALQQLPNGGIDLVLMDCQMPGIDGFEATRQWRAREWAEGRPRLPVLAVTASVEPEDIERLRAAGMDDVLGKPYTVVQLAQLLRRWLPAQPSK